MLPMNPRPKALWLDALRSGKYAQGQEVLASPHAETTVYCCLGVLCEVAVAEGILAPATVGPLRQPLKYGTEQMTVALPREVTEWAGCLADPSVKVTEMMASDLGIPGSRYTSLSVVNDGFIPFTVIADLIEENL